MSTLPEPEAPAMARRPELLSRETRDLARRAEEVCAEARRLCEEVRRSRDVALEGYAELSRRLDEEADWEVV
jgi:hypothetical protein